MDVSRRIRDVSDTLSGSNAVAPGPGETMRECIRTDRFIHDHPFRTWNDIDQRL